MDDLDARHAAEASFATANVPTQVKGTLGVIVSAFQQRLVTQDQAIMLVQAIKSRPDVWIGADLCDRVIDSLTEVS